MGGGVEKSGKLACSIALCLPSHMFASNKALFEEALERQAAAVLAVGRVVVAGVAHDVDEPGVVAEPAPEAVRRNVDITHREEIVDAVFTQLVGPAHVTILEQGNEIVGKRPIHRILEIEHAGIVIVRDHQVPGVEVAVHEDSRLRDGLGDNDVHGVIP